MYVCLLSVCLSVGGYAQTTGRNSCSIVSGDISNCSYRLPFLPLTRLHLSSAQHILYSRKTPKRAQTPSHCASVQLNEPAIRQKGAVTAVTVDRQRPIGMALQL